MFNTIGTHIQREIFKHNPIDEALEVMEIIKRNNCTHQKVASILGISRTKVTNLLRLLRLEPEVQKFIIKGMLSEEHGRILAGISEKTKQCEYGRRAAIEKWGSRRLAAELCEKETLGQKVPPCPNTHRLVNQLSDYFGATINIDLNPNNVGTLKIAFNSLDELEGIFIKMGFKTG